MQSPFSSLSLNMSMKQKEAEKQANQKSKAKNQTSPPLKYDLFEERERKGGGFLVSDSGF